MKALTLHQPWASLVADRKKRIETRSWGTAYRGPLAIHAGRTIDRDACKRFGYETRDIPAGAVVAIADLVDCVRIPNPAAPPDEYGDFTEDRYGWILDSIRPLNTPVPAGGAIGLWNWSPPDDIILEYIVREIVMQTGLSLQRVCDEIDDGIEAPKDLLTQVNSALALADKLKVNVELIRPDIHLRETEEDV